MFVTFYVTTDLSAPIISNPNQRMACARTRSKSIAASSPVNNFMLPAHTCDAFHDNSDSCTMIKEELWLPVMSHSSVMAVANSALRQGFSWHLLSLLALIKRTAGLVSATTARVLPPIW